MYLSRNEMINCKKCNFGNINGTRFCQNCGNILTQKKRLLDSLNLSSLAGMGLKDSSIAPLFTEDFLKKLSTSQIDPIHDQNKIPVIPKKDGSWFCPDCGAKNGKYAIFCNDCGRCK